MRLLYIRPGTEEECLEEANMNAHNTFHRSFIRKDEPKYDLKSTIEMNHQENYLQGLEEKKAPMNTFSDSAGSCVYDFTKTKDDMSNWINLESFLIRDFNIVTSHGICPDCIEK